MSNERIHWIDWCKVIAISLVVWAHITPFLHDEIFLFHMPLFFIISGYLYKQRETKQELISILLCLVCPYLIYNIIYILPLPLGGGYQKGYITNILLGNQEALAFLYVPLWFIVALIIIRLVAILKCVNIYSLTFFILLSYILFDLLKIDQTNDFFQLKTACLCFPFFIGGHILRQSSIMDIPIGKGIKKIFSYLPIFIILFVTLVIIGLDNSNANGNGINVYHCYIGNSIFVFYLVAFFISVMIMLMCKTFLNFGSKIIKRLSNGTLLILAVHLIILWKTPKIGVECIIEPIIDTIVIMFVCYWLIYLSEKFIPELIGKRR